MSLSNDVRTGQVMKSELRFAKLWLPIVVLLVSMLVIPVTQLAGLDRMPGDIGDSRLNNYFLEHAYKFLLGADASLWDLPFFYPFPYVLGFSDNLFGSAPIYAAIRILGAQPDTSLQIWFFCGYVFNFAAAYWALVRLGLTSAGAAMGALVFSFALPTSAHAGHVQLHYRFGVPLAFVYFLNFLDLKQWRLFAAACAWTVWQFYCGIYIGFLLLLLFSGASIVYVLNELFVKRENFYRIFCPFVMSWMAMAKKDKWRLVMWLLLCVSLMAWLFYPYIQVSRFYGVGRDWPEIASMLPRPQSYFGADVSKVWAPMLSSLMKDIPMRHEHQMFVGLIPIMLAIYGAVFGWRCAKREASYVLILGTLILVIGITLCIGGWSAWYLLHKLPLFSAIRAMTRIDLVILFIVGYLCSLAIDRISLLRNVVAIPMIVVLFVLAIVEFSNIGMPVSTKQSWRDRISEAEKNLPTGLIKGDVVFMAQRGGPPYADELDVMWIAMERGLKTMNGYSGNYPPGYLYDYGSNCDEAPKRIASYSSFSQRTNDSNIFNDAAIRIHLIGFDHCRSSK